MTGTSTHPPLALQQLRLDDALALLGHAKKAALPVAQPHSLQNLQAIIDGLCELSLRDPLTGCTNRRHFDAVLERELDRVARSGEVALLLMVDIDHFKPINDLHGHNIGDEVLQQVAQALGRCVRPMDTLARYGGEEFAIVLPACQPVYGQRVAERVRQAVESLIIPIAPHKHLTVTVSIGGAYALQWIRSTRQLWIERADLQLYRAKHAGRNRIEIEQQPDDTVTAEEKSLLLNTECMQTHSDQTSDWQQVLADPTDLANGFAEDRP